jgi:hypothetical protein
MEREREKLRISWHSNPFTWPGSSANCCVAEARKKFPLDCADCFFTAARSLYSIAHRTKSLTLMSHNELDLAITSRALRRLNCEDFHSYYVQSSLHYVDLNKTRYPFQRRFFSSSVRLSFIIECDFQRGGKRVDERFHDKL